MRRRNYFALLIGGVLALVTAYCVISNIHFLSTSEVATGKVAHFKFGKHHPVIAFDVQDGRHYETSVSSWWNLEIGQSTQVRYYRDDPEGSVTIDTFADHWDYILLLTFLAMVTLIAGFRGVQFREDLGQ
ncbi:DUF3592 domain-containing protein [Burkholderia contaminans]|nr:DUF3592 domain-containing protein [Burkholderia contaminans]